jgi:formylmethanofuran dehydrogenase subunit E
MQVFQKILFIVGDGSFMNVIVPKDLPVAGNRGVRMKDHGIDNLHLVQA